MKLNSHVLVTVLAVMFSAGASISFARSSAPRVDVPAQFAMEPQVAPAAVYAQTPNAGGCGCGGAGCDGSCGGGCGGGAGCGIGGGCGR